MVYRSILVIFSIHHNLSEKQIPSIIDKVQDDSVEIRMTVDKIMNDNCNILYDSSLKKDITI